MLSNYYYNILNPIEQNVYTAIYNALISRMPTCTITNNGLANPGADIKRIQQSVTLDHPEIIHYPALFFETVPMGTATKLLFEYTTVDQNVFNKRLNGIINEIEKSLPSYASDYFVCKKIYDAIASFVEYDYEVLKEYKELDKGNASNDRKFQFMEERSIVFTPYGIIMNSKGVCEGIAKLFKIVCDKFGIQCACVLAKNKEGIEHMLNVVEIDGERSYVDVTAGLKSQFKHLDMVLYKYFLMPSRVYNKENTVVTEFECNCEENSFFSKNGLWFKSFTLLREYLCAYRFSSTNGEIQVFYDGDMLNDKELKKAFSEILSHHLPENYRIAGISVDKGFCFGKIDRSINDNDSEE